MNEVGQFRRMNQCFQIKERFKDDEERYKDFLSIMIELKDKGYQKLCFCLQCRIGDGSLIQRLKYLFEGNTDLLKKFTVFLPPDSGIDLLSDPPFQPFQQQVPRQYIPPQALFFSSNYSSIVQFKMNKKQQQTMYLWLEIVLKMMVDRLMLVL